MKVAVLGAGGFVGATLCERLYFEKEHEVVPVIHSSGGAARIARLPLAIRIADVLDCAQLEAVLEGCDAIVNCSRGDEMVMSRGLQNVIKAARACHIKRIVHVSSIAIYGSHPSPESTAESAPPSPDDPYGFWKLCQDQMLLAAQRSGIDVILLCPANIYGPYAPYITGVVDFLRGHPIVIVDGGNNPTNHVHVYNLVEAMICALRSDTGWGERYFVNETEKITWRQFYQDMSAMIGLESRFESVPREDVERARSRPRARAGLTDNVKALFSGEFRRALGVLPAFGAVNEYAYRQFSRVDPRFQRWLREKMARPTLIAKESNGLRLDHKFIREQTKSVYHSPAKIMTALAFRPFSYRQVMESVREWLEFASSETS